MRTILVGALEQARAAIEDILATGRLRHSDQLEFFANLEAYCFCEEEKLRTSIDTKIKRRLNRAADRKAP